MSKMTFLRITFVSGLSYLIAATVFLALPMTWGSRVQSQDFDLPEPLIEMIAHSARFSNAVFSYDHYSTLAEKRYDKPLGSEAAKVEFGSIQLDFHRMAYRYDAYFRLGVDGPFIDHRVVVLKDGVFTVVYDRLDGSEPKYAVIGGNKRRFSPFDMLGCGFGISNSLGMDPDHLKNLSEYLVNNDHMGVFQDDSDNVFTIRNIGSKKLFSGPYRTDLIIELDSHHGNLPKRLDFRVRSSSNDPSVDFSSVVVSVNKFSSESKLFFPLAIHRQNGNETVGGQSMTEIKEDSLRINVDGSELDFGLDLTGIPGLDRRTNTKFNVIEDVKATPTDLFRRTAIEIDRESTSKLNSAYFGRSLKTVFFLGLLFALIIGVFVIRQFRSSRWTFLWFIVSLNTLSLGCDEISMKDSAIPLDSSHLKEPLKPLVELPFVIDFQRSKPGANLSKVSIPFKNVSRKSCKIVDTSTSCGCLRASWDKSLVEPGEIVQLDCEIAPPKVGSPKTVQITASLSGEAYVGDLQVPIHVKFDIDWTVEEHSPIEGELGQIGVGRMIVVVKPNAVAPKLALDGDPSVKLREPSPYPNDSRRFIYTYESLVSEVGSSPLGSFSVVGEPGMFPENYDLDIMLDGRYPGTWSDRLIVVRKDEKLMLRFTPSEGWALLNVQAEQELIVRVETDKQPSNPQYMVEVSWKERPSGFVSLFAQVERGSNRIDIPLKILFTGARR
jgi:hypothetical protein